MDRVTAPSQIDHMAARRLNTRLVTLDDGHVIHEHDPDGFARDLREFLSELSWALRRRTGNHDHTGAPLSEMDAKLIRAAA